MVLGIHLVTMPSPACALVGLTEDNLLPMSAFQLEGRGKKGRENMFLSFQGHYLKCILHVYSCLIGHHPVV